jgi:FixJ family two-component response regulator
MQLCEPTTITASAHLIETHPGQLSEAKQILLGAGLTVCLHHSGEFLGQDPAEMRGVAICDGHESKLIAHLAPDPCQLPLLVLVPRGDVNTTVAAMRKGAFEAAEAPLDGGGFIVKVANAMAHDERHARYRLERLVTRRRVAALSRREREILNLLLEGLLNKQIAAAIGIRENTVEVHRANLMRKLSARTPVELARIVVSAKAIPRQGPQIAA